jgi:NitT/TauT family transport system substrate-binding protein
MNRRTFLRASSAAGLALAGGLLAACSGGGPAASPPTSAPAPANPAAPAAQTAAQTAPAQTTQASMRLGWLANSQYAGDLVALDKGYFKERGIDMRIDAGGPNIDPVSLTASGSNTIGNVSSIAAMFLARSQGIPVKAFATGLQRHPFAFISTKDKNIRSPEDFVGKKIGIQATARPLIDAVIAKYNLPRDQIEIQVIGSETTPLKTGQVDVITGWVIDAPQMAAIGQDAAPLLLWDMGIHLYAFTYFTTEDVVKSQPEMLASFLGASSKGWSYAAEHPDEATDIALKYGKDLKRDLELQTWKLETPFMWSDTTREKGWGWMEASVWDDAIKAYGDLGLLKNPITSADAMTQDILTRVADRPKA